MQNIFPELSEELKEFRHRKPDIILIYPVRKTCKIIEITVCYDVYIDFAFNNKCELEPVQNFLTNKPWKVDLIVLCFGSLGYIKNNVP